MEKITTIHLINKDGLLTEIERRRKINKECMLGLRNLDYYQGKVDALSDTISFIDTLKIKEVDLDFIKEVDVWIRNNGDTNGFFNVQELAKHFFELGLKAQKGEEPVSEDFEEALASEWKDYNDRGAATVDALEDNTQELAFAKGFYRGSNWKEQKHSIVSEEVEDFALQYAGHHAPYDSCMQEVEDAVKAGANWKEQQMMAKAVNGNVIEDIEEGNGDFLLNAEYLPKSMGLKDRQKVKVIVIKEEEMHIQK